MISISRHTEKELQRGFKSRFLIASHLLCCSSRRRHDAYVVQAALMNGLKLGKSKRGLAGASTVLERTIAARRAISRLFTQVCTNGVLEKGPSCG